MVKRNQPKSQIEAAKRGISIRRDYQDVFSGPKGKKVLLDMMKAHSLLSTPKTLDLAELAYIEGERSVIKRILNYIHTDAAQLEERLNEYAQTIANE